MLVQDRHFEVLDGQTLLKTIPRHTTKEMTRYKAYDVKPTNDQECFRSSEPFVGVLDLGASDVAARRRSPRCARVAVGRG